MLNKISIKFSGKDIYIEKKGIIQDKRCKNCNKLILKEQDFCECGFFRKAEKDSIYWSALLLSLTFVFIVIIGIIIPYHYVGHFFQQENKIQKNNINCLSPLNVQIISLLKKTPYYDYIQNVYTEQKKDNVLLILIKPSFWELMSSEKKQNLIKLVQKYWNNVYKQKHPLSKLTPTVKYANPE